MLSRASRTRYCKVDVADPSFAARHLNRTEQNRRHLFQPWLIRYFTPEASKGGFILCKHTLTMKTWIQALHVVRTYLLCVNTLTQCTVVPSGTDHFMHTGNSSLLKQMLQVRSLTLVVFSQTLQVFRLVTPHLTGSRACVPIFSSPGHPSSCIPCLERGTHPGAYCWQ